MLNLIQQLYARLQSREEGATAVEYGIMVALIAAVIIAAVTAVGEQLIIVFNAVASALTAAVPV